MFFKPRYKFGEITKRWGDADFKKDFDDVLDNWLKQFTKKEIPILLELLKNFYYYTETAIDKKVIELHHKFIQINGENINKVVFAKMPKEFGVANSDIVFHSYWFNNNLLGFATHDVVREFLEKDTVPPVLAIIDDYMGSGDNIIGALIRMFSIAPELQNSKLYILMIHTTVTAQTAVNEFKEKLGLDLTLVYLDDSEKAFSEDYIFPKIEAKLKQEEYRQICEKKAIDSEVVFGYKDIQSLVSFKKTTPNDTLGLFWYSAENFVSLFKRNTAPRNTSLSALKGIARKNSHRDMVLFNIEDNQYNRLIVYCILNGNNFSFSRACEDFGLSMDDLFKKLEFIEKKGYIHIKNGEILPTKETDKKIIRRKLKGWDCAEKSLQKEDKIPLVETTYVPRDFSKSFSGYRK